ncbi:MAG TPA: methanol--corrinoid methyltransferase, partial [Firmicutes bacterium]|nr:methanol--corrinoid methyltransferase [Bacillota bacterium]
LVDSDSYLDPQAYILRPDVVLTISKEILEEPTHYGRAKTAARAAIETLKSAGKEGRVKILEREWPWLDRMQKEVETMPDTEDEAWHAIKERIDITKIIPEDYGLT